MRLFIQNAWQRNSQWLACLAPLTYAYRWASEYRQYAYATGQKPIYQAPVALLVIGNITVGGAGKTPLVIALIHYWQTLGIRVGVISRGYGGDTSKMPMLVEPNSLPRDVGDEPCLIVQKTAVPMAVCPNRAQAIELLWADCQAKNKPLDVIVSDDGLQHYALARDDEWIIVDSERGFGNAKLLPQGFLREPITRLLASKVIFHSQTAHLDLSRLRAHQDFEQVLPTLRYGHMYLKATRLLCYRDYICAIRSSQAHANQVATQDILKAQKVYAVSGIGYPKRFFESLRQLGLDVIEHDFADHHQFTVSDFACFVDDLPIVITEKDMIKIKHLPLPSQIVNKIWILPVLAFLSDEVIKMADEFVKQFVHYNKN